MEATASATAGQAPPAVRLLARWADYSLQSHAYALLLLGSEIVGVRLPATLDPADPHRLVNQLSLLLVGFFVVSVGLEAVLLASWGTTPGKALLGASVRRADGRALTFPEALRRTVFLWVYGMGLAILPVTVVCHLRAHGDLRRRGYVRWDVLAKHRVHQARIHPLRVVVAVLVVLAVVPLGGFGWTAVLHPTAGG